MKSRTHTCGVLSKESVNQSVILNGWISKVRDLGSVIFADLRDRYGKTQLVFNIDILAHNLAVCVYHRRSCKPISQENNKSNTYMK